MVTPYEAVLAQATPAPARGDVRGRVVDSTSRAPIGIATVTVFDSATAAAVAGSPTGADGSFRITIPRTGRYRIRIRAIGFAVRELPTRTLGPSGADLGTITLTPSALQLQVLEVTPPQPDVELAPDRNAYAVHDMPTTRGGNALDVLRNVPGVDVDTDNNVSLRGNGDVVVQINGRPSPLKAAQLGNYLAQLPADMVEKVEIISNPSAREAPEGVAGIINIILRQEPDPGINGALTLGASTRRHADAGGNLGYQHRRLSLYGSYSFRHDDRPRSDSLFRTNTYAAPLTYLAQSGSRPQIQNGHAFTGSGSYELSRHDILSLDAVYTTRSEDERFLVLSRTLDAGLVPIGLSNRETDNINRRYSADVTLAHKHQFADKQHKLSTEFRVLRVQEAGPLTITGQTLARNYIDLLLR